MTDHEALPVAVIGAGPVGLAAAAHLIERGLDPLVLETGPTVGAAMLEWGHVQLFSIWRHNLDPASTRLLKKHGWEAPHPSGLPAGAHIVTDYLRPLAATPELADRVRVGTRVTAVTRQGLDKGRSSGREQTPFLLRTIEADGRPGEILARAVVDASGTWSTRLRWAPGGLPAHGEDEAFAAGLVTGPLPDVRRNGFAGKRTLVVGAGIRPPTRSLHSSSSAAPTRAPPSSGPSGQAPPPGLTAARTPTNSPRAASSARACIASSRPAGSNSSPGSPSSASRSPPAGCGSRPPTVGPSTSIASCPPLDSGPTCRFCPSSASTSTLPSTHRGSSARSPTPTSPATRMRRTQSHSSCHPPESAPRAQRWGRYPAAPIGSTETDLVVERRERMVSCSRQPLVPGVLIGTNGPLIVHEVY